MDVRRGAHLKRYAPVPHEGRQSTQPDGAVGLDGDVIDDPRPVPQPFRAAELERLPDRRQPERFPGVDGDVEVLMADPVERLEMSGRSIAGFRAGDIEADDPRVPPSDGRLRDLDRAGRLAHGGDEDLHGDGMARRGGALRTDPEALDVGLDHLVQRQLPLGREFGCVAHFRIDDAVSREILGALGRDPHDRVALLEHADGVDKGFEVQLERLSIGSASDPRREIVRIGGRETTVTVLGGQVDNRRRSKASVKMIVEQGLGSALDGIERQHGRPPERFADGIA